MSFDNASPSTRFPASETTIIAIDSPAKTLKKELDKIAKKDKFEILKTSKAVTSTTNAHIIGRPMRAVKYGYPAAGVI